MIKPTTTTKSNRLLTALDQEIGFANRIDSRITKIKRGYDEKFGEYIIWIEYRTRVKPGILKEKEQRPTRFPLMRKIAGL